MPLLPRLRRVFRLPRRTARMLAADVDEELRFHLDMRTAELVARRQLDEDAARREALRQFGDVEDARRYIRALDARTETLTRRRELVADLWQDLRYAVRALRRSPGFTLTVVLVLALGIGAVTSIVTLVDAVLLRSLPVHDPGRLVAFGDPAAVGRVMSGPQSTNLFSYPLYAELRARARRVSGLLAAGRIGHVDVLVPDAAGASAAASAAPERLRTVLVSGNYFAVLGVRPAAGRLLGDRDDGAAPASVAVVSHAYWQHRFALDPAVVGRTILVNRTPVTVVGVAPAGFLGEAVGSAPELWLPLALQPLVAPGETWMRDRTTSWLMLMGRLAPGATTAQAGEELTALARQAIADAAGGRLPPELADARVEARSGARGFSRVREEMRAPLAILLAATGLVLLIVCANVVNLLLARAATRRTEVGVRLALGAGRRRLVRQLLTESLVLGAAAGVLGVGVAHVGVALLTRVAASAGTTIAFDVGLDGRVLGFTATLTLLTAVLVGLVPAARATGGDLAPTLRAHARGLTGGALGGGRRFGVGGLLVAAQIALSLVLLAGAGLLGRSLRNLQDAPLGLARDALLVVDVDLRETGFRGERFQLLARPLTERLAAIPGARAATYSANGLFGAIDGWTTLRVDGFVARTADDTTAHFDRVGPGYFATIGARVLRGRDVEARDAAGAPRVAVINAAMARFYFGGRDPVGQSIHLDSTRFEVIGVVADVTDQHVRAEPPRRLYTALAQGDGPGMVTFVVRAEGDPARLVPSVRQAILAADPSLRVLAAQPLTSLLRRSVAQERLLARLAAVAGAVALALAVMGLYGVLSYAVVERRGEFGLRMALGARPVDVTRMVLRESLTLFAVGAAVGLPACLAAGRLVRHQLVGIAPFDPAILLGALLVLGASAAVAGYRPASRAARVPPQAALHER